MRFHCNKLGLFATLLMGIGCSGGAQHTGPEASDDADASQNENVVVGNDGSPGNGSNTSATGSGTDPDTHRSGDAGVSDAMARDGQSPALAPFEGQGVPWLAPAPRASCGQGEQPDGTLSGLNGDFRCNLEVAGQIVAPHFLSFAWHDDCAYVNGNDGTTVLHVAPDGTPTVTTRLTQVGFLSNWESMKVSPQSGLLVGYESNGSYLTAYDVSADCKAPVLQSSTRVGDATGSLGHAGSFSPDGTIYYASSMFSGAVYAVDLALPKAPVVLDSTFERSAHDLFIGKSGNRGYFAYPELTNFQGGAFAIMDLTEVQARKPGAKGKLIKQVKWEDGATTQYPIAISYRGKDYLMISDELGSGNCDDPKRPQWGYARIFDINDEQNPTLVSLIKTEAQDPKNCTAVAQANGGTAGFGLGTHYCNVDRLDDPRVLACGNWDGGLRVYDIRNPWRPREVAYFDTPAADMPGLARIYVERRQIWMAVTAGIFYALKIPSGTELDKILAD